MNVPTNIATKSEAAEIRIRTATVEDAPLLAAAEVETARTPGLLVSKPEELNANAFAMRIAELGAPGLRGRYIVACNERGEIVGHALLDPMPLARLAHVFRLTIVVHPAHTAKGIGRAMMNDLLEWAQRDSRVEKIELLVRATNERAIRLYRSCGFVEEGRFTRRIKLGDGSYVDDIAMAWFTK
jgi:RimJ/RimL family protein N-acetyltransferase